MTANKAPNFCAEIIEVKLSVPQNTLTCMTCHVEIYPDNCDPIPGKDEMESSVMSRERRYQKLASS